MPLVLAAGSLLDADPMALIDAAAAAGFDGVGLRLSADHATTDPSAVAAHARDRGVFVHDAEVHRIGADPHRVGPLLEAAAAAGARNVLVVSDLAGDRLATTAAVNALVERAVTLGLGVGLEYMAWTEPSRPLDALAVAEQTGCVLVVDVLHHTRLGAGPDELASIVAAGRLGWLQLCDAPLDPPSPADHASWITEARHGRLLPGTGALPLAALLGVTPADAVISVEVQSDELLAVAPGERAARLHAAATAVLTAAGRGQPSSTG